jgi:hypothetical protein
MKRSLFIIFCVGLLSCSRQPKGLPSPAGWYSLNSNEKLVHELILDAQQSTNIAIQSTSNIMLGFKTDVSIADAKQNRNSTVTLSSINTSGSVSSGIGAETRFEASAQGIHLAVSNEFPFAVRIAIFQDTTP